jgi:hypothetical protein
LAALGLMTYFSHQATGRALDHLETKPQHLADQHVPSPDHLKSTKEKLDTLVDPKGTLDLTAPPIVEGHTSKPQKAAQTKGKAGRHKTTVTIAEAHQPPPKTVDPEETDFAKAFPNDGRLQFVSFTKENITIKDRDGFYFTANCHDHSVFVTIKTVNYKAVPPVRSKVLNAKTLYPLMYEHFEQVGNKVNRLEAIWVEKNYEDAKKVYDKLLMEGKSSADAAFEAVRHARTYKNYHLKEGLTKVVSAEAGEGGFIVEFEREEGGSR